MVVERCGEDLLEGRVGARPEVVGDLSKGSPASRRGLAPRAPGRGWRAASERVEACAERSWRQSPRGPESVFESCGGRRRGACAGLTARPPRVVVEGHGSQPFEGLRGAPSPARRKCFDQLLRVSHGGVRRALNAAASRSGKSSRRSSSIAFGGCRMWLLATSQKPLSDRRDWPRAGLATLCDSRLNAAVGRPQTREPGTAEERRRARLRNVLPAVRWSILLRLRAPSCQTGTPVSGSSAPLSKARFAASRALPTAPPGARQAMKACAERR